MFHELMSGQVVATLHKKGWYQLVMSYIQMDWYNQRVTEFEYYKV